MAPKYGAGVVSAAVGTSKIRAWGKSILENVTDMVTAPMSRP